MSHRHIYFLHVFPVPVPKGLKEIFETCGHIILNIINTSLGTAKIPTAFKVSTMVPVNNRTIKDSEFHPIDVFSPIEKVLETVAYSQI